mgnify:CR=1 FL=1
MAPKPTQILSPQEAKKTIIKEALEGLSPRQIAASHPVSYELIQHTLRTVGIRALAEEVSTKVQEAIFKDKVPVLKAIAEYGLLALYQWLERFIEKKQHLDLKLSQAKTLVDIIEKLHTMYRLEIGRSTSNIDFSVTKTEQNLSVILASLNAPPELGGDPFGSPKHEQ